MIQNNKREKITKILFIIYLIALVEIIIFKLGAFHMGTLRNINLIPFKEALSVNDYLNDYQIMMNIFIFIPFGIYLEMLFKKPSFIKLTIIIAGASILCEVLQFIMGIGISDITDVITNTFGGILGLILMKVLIKLFKQKEKACKIVNILAVIGTVMAVLLIAILLIVN